MHHCENIFVRATRHIDPFVQKLEGGVCIATWDRIAAPKSQSRNDLMTCDAKRSESMAATINCEEMNARERTKKITDNFTCGLLPLPKKSFDAETKAVENLSDSSQQPLDASFNSPSRESFGSPFIRAEEIAPLCRVSVRTWRAWDAAGFIPNPIRIGRTKLWKREEFYAWCAAGCPTRDVWEKSPEIPRKHALRRGQR
jgi:hypothetical protein